MVIGFITVAYLKMIIRQSQKSGCLFRYNSHVTRLSKLSTRERTRLDCMNEKSKHCNDEH